MIGFNGYGTALKPAFETITLAMKPTDGTFAENALRHGVAGLNIDGGRIGTEKSIPNGTRSGSLGREVTSGYQGGWGARDATQSGCNPNLGRWPANLVLDEGSARLLDEMSGFLHAPGFVNPSHIPSGRYKSQSIWRGIGDGRKPFDYKDGGGGASRFFYCAKASRREREAGLYGIEIVMVESPAWDDAGQRVKLRVDTEQSPPRVISGYGMSERDATEWSTFLFGKQGTAPSLTGIRFTTATGTSSTTESRTLNWLARSLTSGCTADASGVAANGGSPAESAESRTPQLTTTAARTVSLPGVGTVASGTRLRISGNAGSPADHPTVKPLALCEYLARLILPPKRDTPRRLLVPFSGSGSEMIGALLAGWDEVVGIEREAEYVTIAEARLKHWTEGAQLELTA